MPALVFGETSQAQSPTPTPNLPNSYFPKYAEKHQGFLPAVKNCLCSTSAARHRPRVLGPCFPMVSCSSAHFELCAGGRSTSAARHRPRVPGPCFPLVFLQPCPLWVHIRGRRWCKFVNWLALSFLRFET